MARHAARHCGVFGSLDIQHIPGPEASLDRRYHFDCALFWFLWNFDPTLGAVP